MSIYLILKTLLNDLQYLSNRVKTHSTLGGLMKNETLKEFIKEKYYEQKMSAEYELQLTKIVELEKKFTKDFSKDKWREYFNIDLAIGELHSIELNQIINFVVYYSIQYI